MNQTGNVEDQSLLIFLINKYLQNLKVLDVEILKKLEENVKKKKKYQFFFF